MESEEEVFSSTLKGLHLKRRENRKGNSRRGLTGIPRLILKELGVSRSQAAQRIPLEEFKGRKET